MKFIVKFNNSKFEFGTEKPARIFANTKFVQEKSKRVELSCLKNNKLIYKIFKTNNKPIWQLSKENIKR